VAQVTDRRTADAAIVVGQHGKTPTDQKLGEGTGALARRGGGRIDLAGDSVRARALVDGGRKTAAVGGDQLDIVALVGDHCGAAALSVLRSRQAMVIGPTPAGTGVIAPATSAASA